MNAEQQEQTNTGDAAGFFSRHGVIIWPPRAWDAHAAAHVLPLRASVRLLCRPSRPAGTTLEVKKSTHKKLLAFLQHLERLELISCAFTPE